MNYPIIHSHHETNEKSYTRHAHRTRASPCRRARWGATSSSRCASRQASRLPCLSSGSSSAICKSWSYRLLAKVALVNKLGGSFAKIGTMDYLCWAKRKMFLLANRNVSDREQKVFSPRTENLLTANRKSVETIEKSLSPMRIKKSKHVHHDRGYYRPTRGNFGR